MILYSNRNGNIIEQGTFTENSTHYIFNNECYFDKNTTSIIDLPDVDDIGNYKIENGAIVRVPTNIRYSRRDIWLLMGIGYMTDIEAYDIVIEERYNDGLIDYATKISQLKAMRALTNFFNRLDYIIAVDPDYSYYLNQLLALDFIDQTKYDEMIALMGS